MDNAERRESKRDISVRPKKRRLSPHYHYESQAAIAKNDDAAPAAKQRQLGIVNLHYPNGTKRVFGLEDFSDEMLYEIFKHLDTWTILALMNSSSRFVNLLLDRRFWTHIDLSKSPLPFGILEDTLVRAHDKTHTIKLCGPSSAQHVKGEFKQFTTILYTIFPTLQTHLQILELQGVSLDFNYITITNFPKSLKRLVLRDCSVIIPEDVKTIFQSVETHLVTLEELGIEDNTWFEPYFIMAISKLPALRSLSLKGCQRMCKSVPYGSMAARFGFQKLEILDLRSTPINNADLQCFGAIETLKQLLLERPKDKNSVDDVKSYVLGEKANSEESDKDKLKRSGNVVEGQHDGSSVENVVNMRARARSLGFNPLAVNTKIIAPHYHMSYTNGRQMPPAEQPNSPSSTDANANSSGSQTCSVYSSGTDSDGDNSNPGKNIAGNNVRPRLDDVISLSDPAFSVLLNKLIPNPDDDNKPCTSQQAKSRIVPSNLQSSLDNIPSTSNSILTSSNLHSLETNADLSSSSSIKSHKASSSSSSSSKSQKVDEEKPTTSKKIRKYSTSSDDGPTVSKNEQNPEASTNGVATDKNISDFQYPSDVSTGCNSDLDSDNESRNGKFDKDIPYSNFTNNRDENDDGDDDDDDDDDDDMDMNNDTTSRNSSPDSAPTLSVPAPNLNRSPRLSPPSPLVVIRLNAPNVEQNQPPPPPPPGTPPRAFIVYPNRDRNVEAVLQRMETIRSNMRLLHQRRAVAGNNPAVSRFLPRPDQIIYMNPQNPREPLFVMQSRRHHFNYTAQPRHPIGGAQPARQGNQLDQVLGHPMFWNMFFSTNRSAGRRQRSHTISMDVCTQISDRAMYSFGRATNPVEPGVIWIRNINRSLNNRLERIILRNYTQITNLTLQHLVQCSPNLQYIDVSGTTVTRSGVKAFAARKPECEIVATHLLGDDDDDDDADADSDSGSSNSDNNNDEQHPPPPPPPPPPSASAHPMPPAEIMHHV